MLTAIVERSGLGQVNADWTVSQTNIDGAVTGPASSTDNYIALFNGTTGKLLKQAAGAIGTMAYETAANYVPKSLYDAYSILYADTDNTPAALTVGASTFVGRKAAGGISAMTAAEARTILNVADGATSNTGTVTSVGITPGTGISVSGSPVTGSGSITVTNTSPNATHTGDVTGATALTIATSAVTLAKMANVDTSTVFYRKSAGTGAPEVQTLATLKTDLGSMPLAWVTAPVDKIGTGYSGSAVASQMARDSNFIYVCHTGGAAGAQVWKRSPIVTNW
jgi:hypothetical protein